MLTCAYDTGGKKLLICSVLMGKTFQCTNLIHGADLQDGHDSHTAPGTQASDPLESLFPLSLLALTRLCLVVADVKGGQEWVIFNPAQVLPCYLVSLGQQGAHHGNTY
jgi:hypothetical protein